MMIHCTLILSLVISSVHAMMEKEDDCVAPETIAARKHTTTFIVTTPCSGGSVLLRSFATRKGCLVVHEPFTAVHDRKIKNDVPYPPEKLLLLFEEELESLEKKASGKHLVIKDISTKMCAFITRTLLAKRLIQRHHRFVFLLRPASESIASYLRKIEALGTPIVLKNQKLILERAPAYFNYEATLMAFLRLKESYPMQVSAVKFKNLIDHPDLEVAKVCKSVGVPYDKSMLTWEPAKTFEEANIDSHIPNASKIVFFQKALLSSGFNKTPKVEMPETTNHACFEATKRSLVGELQPHYTTLKKHVDSFTNLYETPLAKKTYRRLKTARKTA